MNVPYSSAGALVLGGEPPVMLYLAPFKKTQHGLCIAYVYRHQQWGTTL